MRQGNEDESTQALRRLKETCKWITLHSDKIMYYS
jgi:hypothetical protein